MIISIHIPKTGGTALATYLDYGTRRSILYDYDDAVIKNDREFISKYKEFLDRFSVIHGHFHYTKYKDVFPSAAFISCLRDPVERTISNYVHVMREKNMNVYSYRRIVEDKLDIVGFAELPNMSRAQSIYLRGREVEDYDFIGITEELDASVDMLCRLFGINKVNPLHRTNLFGRPLRINANPFKLRALWEHGRVTKGVRKRIARACEEDMDLYNRALARFQKQKQEYF